MKTLLLLEDDPYVMNLLRRVLRGFYLLEAATAEEALHRFVDHGRHIDLLLADVSLPGSSGLRVAFFLRSEVQDLPVILTSGYPVDTWSDQDRADLERLGPRAVSVLQKPFEACVLMNLVQRLLGTAPSESAIDLPAQ